MIKSILASKKSIIILTIVVVSILLTLTSYYMKKARLERETRLGGEIEIISSGPLSPAEYRFVRGNAAKLSYVADLKTPLPLPNGVFLSNVRGFDKSYPLRGNMQINPMGMRGVFIHDKRKQLFGVAVNQLFLDQTGMKIGDIFSMNRRNYQLRGVILWLPDASGQAMNKEPLLMLRDYAERRNGMWANSSMHGLRYRLISKRISAKNFQAEYKKQFPTSSVTINRADAR